MVLQEIFGANQHVRKVADLYASQGYDAAQMLAVGLAATKGDAKKK